MHLADTPKQLARRDTDRIRTYARRLAFYRGDQWATQRNSWTRQRGQRQLTLNYTRALIVKATSYVIQDLQYVADALGDTDDAAAQARAAELAFESVADANALRLLDFETELDCSVLGDAAWKVTWSGTGVKIGAVDVTGLHAWRRPDDLETLLRVAHVYDVSRDDALALYGVRTQRAKAQFIEEWDADTYTLWVDGNPVVDNAPNTYGFIPYVIYPNLREPKQEWGASDIDGIEEPARELNRQLTQLSLICELSGQPITVLEGVAEGNDIAVQPGAVWELPEGAKAYVLDLLANGGVSMMLSFAELMRAVLHDLGETPRSAFGDSDAALSGVALKIALDPLTKKVARKRLIRERALRARNAMVMALLGRYAGLDAAVAAHTLRPVWSDVSPADRSRDVADGVALVNVGALSRRRLAAELGADDPDLEWQRWLEEADQMLDVQPRLSPTPARQSDPLA